MSKSLALYSLCFVALNLSWQGFGAEPDGKGSNLAAEPISFQVSVALEDPFDPKYARDQKGPVKIRRGELAKLIIEARLQPGYHTYPLTSRTALQHPAKVWNYKPAETQGLLPLWPIFETSPDLVDEPEGNKNITIQEHRKDFTWVQDILILPEATPGTQVLPINLKGIVCNEQGCLPYKTSLKATFEISDEKPVSPETKALERKTQSPLQIVTIPGQESSPLSPVEPTTVTVPTSSGEQNGIFLPIKLTAEEYKAAMESLVPRFQKKGNIDGLAAGGAADLWAFILTGIFWGGVSLVTPCVFPMIPITVSFFLKQSEKEHHRPITMALVYSGTIVIVLTLAAAFLLSVFRMLSINPIMNYGLGALFVFFALSLFGMYDIELPSSLARFTSSHEGQGGLVGTMFMALTFTILSFACVAPFLGGFGGTAAGIARPWWHNILGGLGFSVTFAAPFFFLALFPTLLRQMPKSGSWLNTVKVAMGFLELAAAFKFFRSAELVLTSGSPWLFTFDLVLGIYVALCFLCGLYLLGLFRLPHDTPEENLGVPRMLFSCLFLALGFYFLPALFKGHEGEPQRPTGTVYAWVDSFLLPEARIAKEEPSTANLPAALAKAREQSQKTGQPQRIFLDFTGVTCTNCNINENNVFSRPEIRKLLANYRVVKLYTDIVPRHYYSSEVQARLAANNGRPETDAEVNLAFQKKVFNTEQLPLYVILEPHQDDTVEVLGVYPEGRINDEAAFAAFLREPIHNK